MVIGKLKTFRNKFLTGLAVLALATGITLTPKKINSYETGTLEDPSIHPLLVEKLNGFYQPPAGLDFLVRRIQQGSINEDSPAEPIGKQYSRSLNHFQHWQTSQGLECEFDICNIIKPAGVEKILSASEWVNSPEVQAQYPFGDHTWERAKEDYQLGIISEHFGYIFHLISDLTVPAHVRNDVHIALWGINAGIALWDKDDYEAWTDKYKSVIMGSVRPQSLPQANSLEELMFQAAGFTGSNFYSDDSWDGTVEGLTVSWEGNKIYLVKDIERQRRHIFRTTLLINFQDYTCFEDEWSVLGTKAVEYGAAALKLLESEQPVCSDECSPSGKKQCSGNGYKTCGNYDADDCLEWSPLSPCEASQTCRNGECVSDIICTDNDGDGYGTNCSLGNDCNDNNRNIHPGVAELCDGIDNNCASGTDEGCSCVNGRTQQCGQTDVGECSYGTQTCSSGSWGNCNGAINPINEICNNKDDDCDSSTDEGNVCGSTCTDECNAGQKECVGNNYKICGDYDADDCLEWSVLTNCGIIKTCQEGECVALEGKIAFTSYRDGNSEIYVMNADGSDQTRLTNQTQDDYYPAWSPDVTKIAFASNRDGNLEIYVMNADGSNQTRLTNQTQDDYYPTWSPDGTKIAFASRRNGNPEIYVMNADGSDQTRLGDQTHGGYQPAWSPDGTKIAFASDRYGGSEIYVMNADGSDQTILTSQIQDYYYPAWSPDGTKIAFAPYWDGNYEIYVMNADGTSQINLTNNPGSNTDPSWSW